MYSTVKNPKNALGDTVRLGYVGNYSKFSPELFANGITYYNTLCSVQS